MRFCFQIRNGIDFDVSLAIEQLCRPGLNRQVKISGPDLSFQAGKRPNFEIIFPGLMFLEKKDF